MVARGDMARLKNYAGRGSGRRRGPVVRTALPRWPRVKLWSWADRAKMLAALYYARERRRITNWFSSARDFLMGEPQGLAIDFTDDHWAADTGHYGSAYIADATGAVSEYDGHPYGLLTYSSPSAKFLRGPSGTYRFGAHNLYLNSASPANQSITVVSGATYAVTITGSVSVTASGAATGTWTAGTTEFTAASTTLTLGSTSGSGTVHVRRTPSDSTYLETAGAARYALPYEWDASGNLLGIAVEPERTNVFPNSRDLTASLYSSGMTRTKTATGIDGVANSASRITATANNAYVGNYFTPSNGVNTISCFARRVTGSGNVYFGVTNYGFAGTGSETTTGSNLVSNGTFDAGITGWTTHGGDASNYFDWDGVGALRAQYTSGGIQAGVYTVLSGLTPGKYYRFTFTVTAGSGTLSGRAGPHYGGQGVQYFSAGTYHVLFMALDTAQSIGFYTFNSVTGSCTIDNVSCYEVTSMSGQITLTSEWQRFSFQLTASNFWGVSLILATSGDVIEVDCVQCELGASASSPIITGSSSVTRAADNIYLPTSSIPMSTEDITLFGECVTLESTTAQQAMIALNASGTYGAGTGLLLRRTGMTATVFGGSASTVSQSSSATVGVAHRSAGVGKNSTNRQAAFSGGSGPTEDTTLDWTGSGTNRVQIGAITSAASQADPAFRLRKVMLLPRGMSDSEAQELTA